VSEFATRWNGLDAAVASEGADEDPPGGVRFRIGQLEPIVQ
jgi:hypothetical protein